MTGAKPPSILDDIVAGTYRPRRAVNNKRLTILDDIINGTLSNQADDEELAAQRLEQEQKASRDETLKNLEKGSFLRSLADQGMSLGQDISQVMGGDLSSVGRGLEQGVKGVGELFKYVATTNPLESVPTLGKSLIMDGIVRPFIQTPLQSLFKTEGWKALSPEDQQKRYQEMTANFIGAAIGSGVAKIAGKVRAGPMLSKVLKSSKIDDAIAALSPEDAAKLIAEMPKSGIVGETAKGIATVSGWGVPTALLTGDTPEERFSNAVNYGAASAAIGGMLGGVRFLRGRKSPELYADIKEKATQFNAARTTEEVVKNLPPVEAAFTAQKISEALFDNQPEKILPIVASNVKSGESFVLNDLPGIKFKELQTFKLEKGEVRVATGKGKVIVLGDGVPFTEAQATEFKNSGLFTGAQVERGGALYKVQRIDGVREPRVKLERMDGTTVKKLVPFSEVTLSNKEPVTVNPTSIKVDAKNWKDLNLPSEAQADLDALYAKHEALRDIQVKDLSSKSASKSLLVQFKDGKFRIKDIITDQVVHETDDIQSLHDFSSSIIGRAGEALMSTGEGAPFIVSPDLPKMEMKGQGRLEGMIDRFVVRFPSTTVPYAYFRSVDNLFRTKMQPAYVALHDAKRKLVVSKNDMFKDLYGIATDFYKKLKPSPERMTQLYEAVQTKSADDLLSGDALRRRSQFRDMNPNEIRLGQNIAQLIKTSDELGKTLSIFADAHDQFMNDGVDFDATFGKLADVESLSPEGRQVGQLLKKIRFEGKNMGLDDYSTNLILDLADATVSNKRSRADYLRDIKATPDEIAMVERLSAYTSKVADDLAIDPKSRMNGYMPRIYEQDPVDIKTQKAPNDKRLLAENPDFQHAMHRIGIRQDYLTDPVLALQIYSNRGLRKTYLTEAVKEFRREVENSSSKMLTDVDSRLVTNGVYHKWAGELFKRKSETFLNDFQNFVPPEDLAARAGFEAYMANMGSTDKDLGTLGRIALSFSSTAAMGFAPIQGLRDFFTYAQIVNTFFGPKTLIKSMRLLQQYDTNLDTKMRQQGFIPTDMNRLLFEDQHADIPGASKGLIAKSLTAFDKFADVGFEVSAQALAYRRMHTAMFLERYSTVGDALKSFNSHKNIDKLRSDVHLRSYSTPVQNEFSRLINAGEFVQATNYIAKSTGHEMVGVYGYATHPIGWGTKVGRVAGQFGQWPLWAQQVVGQIATRGDAGVLGRWGLSMAALTGATMATGINFSSWQVSPTNVGFSGGPYAGIAEAMYKSAFAGDPSVKEFYREKILARLDPLDNPKQIYLPVPFAFYNLLSAAGIYEPNEDVAALLRDNPMLAGAKALGFSIKAPQP